MFNGTRLAVILLGYAGTLSTAFASPLAPEVCSNLRTEIHTLEQGGLRAAIARGTETAKSTLTTEQLGLIRRILDLDAQLKFRCPADTGGATVPVKPKPKPKTPKVASPKAAPVAATDPAAEEQVAPNKVATRRKSEAKSDDAYRPPASGPVAAPLSGDASSVPLQKPQAAKPGVP
jgi:hypothetical protein